MPDQYEVRLHFEPILQRGGSSGRMPAPDTVFHSPVDGAIIRVHQKSVPLRNEDGTPAQVRDIWQFFVELTADTPEDAERQALALATRFCQLEALVEDATIAILYRPPSIWNLSHPERRHPRAYVSTMETHLDVDDVESAWTQFEMLADPALRDAVELGMEWVYIGNAARDNRSAFVAYWTALEFVLDHIPSLTPSVTKLTVFDKYGLNKTQRRATLDAVSVALAAWITDEGDRERICKQVTDTKAESDMNRWFAVFAALGVTCQGFAITLDQLQRLQEIRNLLVHRAGMPTTKERKRGKREVVRSVPAAEVKAIAVALLRQLLANGATIHAH